MINYSELIGIDRTTSPAGFLPEVTLEGERIGEFIDWLDAAGQFPNPGWRKARKIVGVKVGNPEPHHDGSMVTLLGVLTGRKWYAFYGEAHPCEVLCPFV